MGSIPLVGAQVAHGIQILSCSSTSSQVRRSPTCLTSLSHSMTAGTWRISTALAKAIPKLVGCGWPTLETGLASRKSVMNASAGCGGTTFSAVAPHLSGGEQSCGNWCTLKRTVRDLMIVITFAQVQNRCLNPSGLVEQLLFMLMMLF